MNEHDVATPIPRDGMRWAISSSEEVWVQVCHMFFEQYGFYEWYLIPKERAFNEMLIASEGTISPQMLRLKIHNLYESVGMK